VLHDGEGRIRRPWQLQRWLVCVLQFRGRKRTVMTPGCYTELFFLDEATALAAGHRPCAECRRERFKAFRAAWAQRGGHYPTAPEIDRRLHAERVGPGRSKQMHTAALNTLPEGTLIQGTKPHQAYLVWGDALLAWSPSGYRERRPRPSSGKVLVLTPRSTVATLRAGYTPEVHPSAGRR
jgi:hypothetical protein